MLECGYRYDRLMRLGWKVFFLPISLAIVAGVLIVIRG